MGYFATERNVEGDNPPIGITLSLKRISYYLSLQK